MDWWHDLLKQNYDWLWDAGIAMCITVAVTLVWRLLRKHLLKLAAKTANRWDDVIIDGIGVPINWMIFVVGAMWVAEISARHFSSEIITSIPVVRQLALIILVAWGLWRLINRVESRQLDKGGDPTTVQLVVKSLNWLLQY